MSLKIQMARACNQIARLVRRDHAQKQSAVVHFASVRDLIKAIKDYVRHYNAARGHFQWVASASKIIRKVNKQIEF